MSYVYASVKCIQYTPELLCSRWYWILDYVCSCYEVRQSIFSKERLDLCSCYTRELASSSWGRRDVESSSVPLNSIIRVLRYMNTLYNILRRTLVQVQTQNPFHYRPHSSAFLYFDVITVMSLWQQSTTRYQEADDSSSQDNCQISLIFHLCTQ